MKRDGKRAPLKTQLLAASVREFYDFYVKSELKIELDFRLTIRYVYFHSAETCAISILLLGKIVLYV